MLSPYANRLAVGLSLLCLLPSYSRSDPPEAKDVWRLKRDVEERERQLNQVQRELAEARARVALAEGKRDAAIRELRKAVDGHEGEIQWLRDHANRFCDPRDLLTEASWNLAKTRAWLAEVEGDTANLVAECKKIVGFQEQQLERINRLEQMQAVKPEERVPVQEALDKARERLAAAEKQSLPKPPEAPASVSLYDSDPGHLWNRLHAALQNRKGQGGKWIGRYSLDPLVFPTTKRLLEGPTHIEAVKLLDEFLAGGHALVRDPLKRAVMQRDLWAVFDWSVYPFGNFYTSGDPIEIRTGPLQERLAKAIHKIAPSRAEAEALPDTYALAVKSKAFPPAFDAAKPNAPFLPSDLFDPSGPWVCVTGPKELGTPIASQHARVFSGRSAFLVFIRLPEGRKETQAYLNKLNAFPKPWNVPPRKEDADDGRRTTTQLNPDVPQFPAGTQVALVRQLMVVTGDGKPVPTALTESVQLRTYHEILPKERDTDGGKAQRFVELEMRRADLLANRNGGLHAIQMDEPVIPALTFFRGWSDPFETKSEDTHHRAEPAARLCAACHSPGGIRSVNCYTQFGVSRPTQTLGLFPTTVADERVRSAKWLTGLKDWAELKRHAGW